MSLTLVQRLAHQAGSRLAWDEDLALELVREILTECNLHTLAEDFSRLVDEREKEAEKEINPF